MSVVISGKLIGPNGDPRAGVTITLRAMKTSSAVVQYAPSTTQTSSDGSYSLTAENGTHEVIIEAYGQPPEKVGTITVFNDSLPGTLNDYLTTPGVSEITPVFIQTVEEMRAAANVASSAAIDAANRSDSAALRAESAASAAASAGKLYADTPTGLAATSSGDIFATPSSDDPTDGITYWLNDSGNAVAVSETLGRAAVEAVSAQFNDTFAADDDNGLIIVDENGFISQAMNPVTGVIGGNRAKITPDSFENEAFTLVGDDSTSLLLVDENGFIGFEVGRDGKILGGGGSDVTTKAIDTDPAILEASALVQWNVLKDSSILKSRIGTDKLTAQAIAPVYRDYGAQLAAWTGALVTALDDRNLYTACFTVQVPSLTNTTDRVAIYSSISSSTTGGGAKLIFALDSDGNIYVIEQISNCWTTALNLPAGIKSGDWIQISHVMAMDNSGSSNYHAIAFGGIAQQIVREADVSPKNLSSYKFALGNAWINSAAYKNVGICVYEMVIYDHALSDAELSTHFKNACVRASADGIQIVKGAV